MTSVAYPVVYAALLEFGDAAVSARLTDGYDLSDDPSDVIQLGVPNLSDTEAISAGTFSQEQVGHGAAGFVKETGSINGIALATNGDGDALAARAAVFGYLDDLGAAIRADRHIGVTDFDLVVGTALANGDVAEDKVDGATCAVSFTVNYTAHI